MSVLASPAHEPARWYAQEVLVGDKIKLVPLQLDHAEATRPRCAPTGEPGMSTAGWPGGPPR